MIQRLHDPDPVVRQRAAHELAHSGGAEAVPLLVNLLQSDPVVGVRESAAGSLGELGGSQATTALLQQAGSTDALEVRHTAVRALGQLKDPATVAGLISLLHVRRSSDDDVVMLDISEALASIGQPALPALAEALSHDSWKVRYHAILAVGAIPGHQLGPRLSALSQDPHPLVRMAAQKALEP